MRQFLVALALAAAATTGEAAGLDDSCGAVQCFIGQSVVIQGEKGDPAILCATRAIFSYAQFVFGMASLSGTREESWQGETAAMRDALRARAGVSSISEASGACRVIDRYVSAVILKIEDTAIQVAPKDGVPGWTGSLLLYPAKKH